VARRLADQEVLRDCDNAVGAFPSVKNQLQIFPCNFFSFLFSSVIL